MARRARRRTTCQPAPARTPSPYLAIALVLLLACLVLTCAFLISAALYRPDVVRLVGMLFVPQVHP